MSELQLETVEQLIRDARFAESEAQLLADLAGRSPVADDVDKLYLLAVSRRYLKKHEESLATLDELLALDHQHARAWQEKGHNLLSLNHLDDAKQAYQGAVHYNASLLASWKALANLFNLSEEFRARDYALNEVKYLSSLPKELMAVSSFIHERKLFKADKLCRHFMREHQQHVEGMRLLANIGEQLDVLADAEFLLETALQLAPDYDRVRYDLANLLLKIQKFEKAHEHTAELVARQPGNLTFLSLHGNATAGIGDHIKAIDIYNEVISVSEGQHKLHVMRGHAEKTIGNLGGAIQSYRRAFELQPDYGDAFWSLANTKTYVFREEEIDQMRAQEQSGTTSDEDRVHLCFALGKAFDDQKDYEQSFVFYERGNALQQLEVKHKPAHLNIRTQSQIEVCSREFMQSRKAAGSPVKDPIFIVGLPRAGSTLLEQILASHSLVDGTMELPNIIGLAQRLRGSAYLVEEQDGKPRYPHVLTELDTDLFRRFGEQFIEETRVYREGAPYFIDKNPNNFFHVGLIKLILPNAKIIDARRHPMSCCFSGFKQLFGQGQEFSYGLETIGNYYREYVELMDHWNAVLPGEVLLVQHEEVVDDLETQVRRMLEFCELPFEQSCVEYYKTDRSVRTPSSEQVRQPIFRSSLEAWQHYDPWLGPLKEALGPEIREQYDIH